MRQKILFTGLLFTFIGTAVFGQQLTFNSQYMLNPYLLNPGAAGADPEHPISLTSRQQWAGFSEAPRTQAIAYNMGFMENMGGGIMFINDQLGPLRNISTHLSYAYHLNVTEGSKIGLGISGIFTQHVLDGSNFVTHHDNDMTLENATQKSFNPDAAFGAWYYGKNYYAGVAAPQLIQGKMKFGDQLSDMNRQVRHYYVSGGYDIPVMEGFNIEPSALLKITERSPMQFDINSRFKYKNKAWVGISYRHKESLVAMAGLNWEQFTLGYSYDNTLSSIRSYSLGTHEIYIQYAIKKESSDTQAKFGKD